MKRIDIHYGSHAYSVGNRELDDLQAEIVAGMQGPPTWLLVNDGEGTRRDAHLLLTPGVSIVVIPIAEDPTSAA